LFGSAGHDLQENIQNPHKVRIRNKILNLWEFCPDFTAVFRKFLDRLNWAINPMESSILFLDSPLSKGALLITYFLHCREICLDIVNKEMVQSWKRGAAV